MAIARSAVPFGRSRATPTVDKPIQHTATDSVKTANLTFQWQRELKDKFREDFEVIRGDVVRANYGFNPWKEKHPVVTYDRRSPGTPFW